MFQKPSKRRAVKVARVACAIAIVGLTVWFGNDLLRLFGPDEPSRSIGSASNGSLENGVRLPSSGPNFETYSRLGSLLGRTSVHRDLGRIVTETYGRLEDDVPEQRWVYGETGWPGGGEFWPHRTHQNGLVVDFMVPLREDPLSNERAVVPFPHALWDGFGYAVELDDEGRMEDGTTIDFAAVATHLGILDEVAREEGFRIRRVIFAPELRRILLRTDEGRSIRRLNFNENPVWVRHDDHYHVEFEPLREP